MIPVTRYDGSSLLINLDVIVAIDGMEVPARRPEDTDVLARQIRQYRSGTEAAFSLWRDGEPYGAMGTVVRDAPLRGEIFITAVAVDTPTLSSTPPTTIFPAKIPIDPVRVPGSATITCPGTAM